MTDRLFFPLLAALFVAMVALAAVWPQGLGDRSPPPFGHQPIQQTAAVKAAMDRETQASEQRLNAARNAVADAQTQAISPTK
ncbi:hypothetical protein [Phenylobacterium sp.]|uniref:hypothetical protein n=1 Tax=Phenylobacterium sp. TaxID=1871053 RepID=UPI0027320E0B|nr:hypothetical protein [Phenylobacterium sp.]MDP1600595.1 hypothetical protein [Phenylobacterium sp.]MDP3594809.1 hypothetical protein [Phenylobacterium sp.]